MEAHSSSRHRHAGSYILSPSQFTKKSVQNSHQNKISILSVIRQKDFIEDEGLMRVDGGKAIVPNVVKAVQVARQRGIFVIWVRFSILPFSSSFLTLETWLKNVVVFLRKVVREHDTQGRDVELFRSRLYGPEKVGPTAKGTVGSELVDGLVIEESDYKLVKTRFSAFFATNLHSLLQRAHIHHLVVTGKFAYMNYKTLWSVWERNWIWK